MTNPKKNFLLFVILLCIHFLALPGSSLHAKEDVSATASAIPKDGAIPWDLFSEAKSTILSLLETEFGKLGRTVGEPARGNYTKASSLAKSGDT
ncbi:MAG: hypothetical protein LBR07_08960, partial [Puniceicoccales bacterium]|nr:hypothetical protein [Puniceicoccales bacterium]